jgi:hypothetical protein
MLGGAARYCCLTMLLALPVAWPLPSLLKEIGALRTAGVHANLAVLDHEVRGGGIHRGHKTDAVYKLAVRAPGGASEWRKVPAETYAASVDAGKLPVVYPAGHPERFRVVGQEWEDVEWRLVVFFGVGLAPLYITLFFLAILRLGELTGQIR